VTSSPDRPTSSPDRPTESAAAPTGSADRFVTSNPDRSPGTLMSGVEGLVHLLSLREAIDERDGLQTATMVSGYPGSPLGTLDLALESASADAPKRMVHRPGLNEELAAAIVWGSQMGATVPYKDVDGVAGVWYGKTPGLDRAGDAIKHGNSMGAGPNGGVVMLCGDDPTAKSSTLACDSQYTFEDACIPVLYPGDQQEVLDLGVHAFRLSRYAGCWVGLKVVTAVADGVGTADLGIQRHKPKDPVGFQVDGVAWRHQPLTTVGAHAVPDQELLVVDRRLRAAKAYARHNGLDRVVGAPPGARVGIVCAGKTYFDVLQALSDLGVARADLAERGVRILKLGMTWPLVEETAIEFASSVAEVVVIEEKRPFVESQLRAILHEEGVPVPVTGKRDRSGRPLAPVVGELDPAAITAILRRVMPDLPADLPDSPSAPKRTLPIVPVFGRPPGFCSGCPHNRSTVFPAGALVGGGVGCHGIMYFEARHAGMKSMPPTPMGAEGVPWIGLAPFVDEPHLIQNLGDGTLSHSGTLAIRASVAAGVNITFKILYNSAVAMTGGQDVTGLLDIPDLTRALEAEGVRRVVVCSDDPGRFGHKARWARGARAVGRDRLPELQEELQAVPGVTVVIYDQRCAAEARRLRKRGLLPEPPRRVVINEAVCEGCGDCTTKSNCLSVLPLPTEFGEKRRIDDPSCNRDYSCLEGDCPSFVTIAPKRSRDHAQPDSPRDPGPGARKPQFPAGSLPTPVSPELHRQYGIYFTGIGGTGVVTANRILAAAARAAGLSVGGMDQTGLSQKAGAVVSHLHLASDRADVGSATVGTAGADLYLSGDILQAAGDRHLEKVQPGRTLAVIDRDLTPTASMLQTGAAPPDITALEGAIAARVGADRVAFVDSKRMAGVLLGNPMLANVILIGAAFQLGGLPLSIEAIRDAVGKEAPGGASDTLEAFEWGRWTIHDPAAVQAVLDSADAGEAEQRSLFEPTARAVASASTLLGGRSLPQELLPLLTRRAAQVIDYQDRARAGRYLDLVERVAATDTAEQEWALTRSVSEAWFKLLTYKDEYEVARLHLRVDYGTIAAEMGIEGPYRVEYHLHPPVLRRLGLGRKLPMGRPYEVAFRALCAMKRLRGTPFDPFGLDPDRRAERQLIEDYERLMADTSEADYATRLRLAASPLSIRGYGAIKEQAIRRWRREVSDLTGAREEQVALGTR
jgi:indolepyruvate ferredoxin oxidoreductase